ncbi:MAG: hypothetical protein ACJ71A_11195 [Nitrososphaeraceae archaeon]
MVYLLDFLCKFKSILAGGIAALYGLDWYKNRKQSKKSTKKLAVEEDYTTKKQLLNN